MTDEAPEIGTDGVPISTILDAADQHMEWILTELEHRTDSHPLVALAVLAQAALAISNATVRDLETPELIASFRQDLDTLRETINKEQAEDSLGLERIN